MGDKHLNFARQLKKTMDHEGDARNNPQRRLENKRTSGDHQDYNIVNTGQNTEKSPGDLERLVITQNPVENHQRNNKFDNYEQMVYAQPSICPREGHTQTPMELWHTNGSPNLS